MPVPQRQAPRPLPQRVPGPPQQGGKAQGGVLDRIRPLQTSAFHSFLVFGDSGTGKTTFWASALDVVKGKILVILCSGGREPGELKSIDPKHKGRIDQVVLESHLEMDTITDMLADEGRDTYSLVVLDHATGFQDLILQRYKGMATIPQQKSWGDASQQDWGEIASLFKERLVKMLSLPMHRVVIAQERVFNPRPETGAYSEVITPKLGSALAPSIAGWLHPACDYNIQTFIRPKMKVVTRSVAGKNVETIERDKGVEFCARTGRHDAVMTKFRVPIGQALPDDVVNPTFARILSLINGAK